NALELGDASSASRFTLKSALGFSCLGRGVLGEAINRVAISGDSILRPPSSCMAVLGLRMQLFVDAFASADMKRSLGRAQVGTGEILIDLDKPRLVGIDLFDDRCMNVLVSELLHDP